MQSLHQAAPAATQRGALAFPSLTARVKPVSKTPVHAARPLLRPVRRRPSVPARAPAAAATGGASEPPIAKSVQPPSGTRGNLAATLLALSLATLSLGTAALVAPARFLEAASLATPSAVIAGLTRGAGASFILVGVVLNCLADAAFHDRLRSWTYRRLAMWLNYWAIPVVWALHLQRAATAPLRSLSVIITVTALVAQFPFFGAWDPHVVGYDDDEDEGFEAPSTLERLLRIVQGNFANFVSFSTATYSLSAAFALALAPVLWEGHIPAILQGSGLPVVLLTQPLGTLGTMMVRVQVAGLVLATMVLLTLAEAAERGRLGASTFKKLNVGVAVWAAMALGVAFQWARLGVLWLDAPPLAAGAMSLLARAVFAWCAVLSSLALYHCFTAKK